MPKLPSVLALTVTTSLLLVGCSFGSPDEPAAETPTASDSPSPSETPTEEETDVAEETAEPTTEPSAVPTAEPTTAAPVPSEEPSTEPEDPFVPPPHGEPNPGAPGGPFVPPPHGEPNPYAGTPHQGSGGSVAHPQAGWPGPSLGIAPGTFTIGGSGYTPGERIEVVLGAPHTDQQLLTQSTVYAGPDGSFTFDIQISPELAGAEYGLMTWAPERGQQAAEDSKRFLSVYVASN